MPITVTPTPVILEAANTWEDSQIQFSNPGYYFPHVAGSPAPDDYNFEATFPLFDTMPLYSNYTNWAVEISFNITTNPYLWLFVNDSFQPVIPWPAAVGDRYVVPLEIRVLNMINNLSAGDYNIIVTLKVTAKVAGLPITVARKDYPVQAVITNAEENFFYVAYSQVNAGGLNFTYMYNSGVLDMQSVFVYHNIEFGVSLQDETSGILQAISVPGANGMSMVQLAYQDPEAEPAPGVYNCFLVLTPEGGEPVNVPIAIYVIDTEGAPLVVLPDALDFVAVKGIEPGPGSKILNLVTDLSWSISNLPSWLILSQVTGAGSATLVISVVGYNSMSPGDYVFDLKVVAGLNQVTVSVMLTVTNYLTSPYRENGLYFSKEAEYLHFISPNTNTYIVISAVIKVYTLGLYRPVTYNRQYDLPLFKGEGSFHLGSVVHQLFEELTSLDLAINEFSQNHTKPQYRPAAVSVYYSEISYASGEQVRAGSVKNFLVAKGLKPNLTSQNTGLLNVVGQDLTRITRNSILNCNFCSFVSAGLSIKKNGVLLQSFNLASSNNSRLVSYNRFVENLVPGDVLEVVVKTTRFFPPLTSIRVRRFLVFPEGKESSHVFFENDNGVVEVYEFTGRRRLSSAYTHTTQERFKDLYAYTEKADQSKNTQSLIINTGYILPGDHRVIDAIIKSQKVWVSFDSYFGPYYQVDATTSKIQNRDTDVNEVSFDVEFNILNNADVSIYIQ